MNDLQIIRSQAPANLTETDAVRQEIADLRAMILAQNALLEQLVQAQAQIRVSRSQERALRQTIHERAAGLQERERLPKAAGRKISGAILATLRTITGCRALGDIPAVKFDQAQNAARTWDMPGALRKIRRSINDL